jgi:hypothetical protein
MVLLVPDIFISYIALIHITLMVPLISLHRYCIRVTPVVPA